VKAGDLALRTPPPSPVIDLAVVGAGPTGIGLGAEARGPDSRLC